jgi:hypothetical protein
VKFELYESQWLARRRDGIDRIDSGALGERAIRELSLRIAGRVCQGRMSVTDCLVNHLKGGFWICHYRFHAAHQQLLNVVEHVYWRREHSR